MNKLITTLSTIAIMGALLTSLTTNAASTKLDVNLDGKIDAVDASLALREYAILSSNGKATFTKTQTYLADTNSDNKIDSVDASYILQTYSRNSIGDTQPLTTITFTPNLMEGGNQPLCDTDTFEEALEVIKEDKERRFAEGDMRKHSYKISMCLYTEPTKTDLAKIVVKYVYEE